MTSIGAFQAKTHLSQLIDKVLKGETIQILRHGKAVAKLVPADASDRLEKSRNAARRIQALSRGIRLGKGLTLKALREEGRP